MKSAYRYHQTDNYYLPSTSAEFGYEDAGGAEDRLYRLICNASDRSLFSNELRGAGSDWPTFYHLTSLRANILRPFAERLATGRTLELGAGCGAVTRFIGELGGRVVAVEGSPKRARVIGQRCKDLPNVEVIADLIQNLEPTEKFDVVTLIGVLEYSRVYVDGEDPVGRVLDIARRFVKEDGLLLVAIENQLGLKYFCGAPEDHVGIPMHGINDAYDERSVVTFGRLELESRIRAAGFGDARTYIPAPDYKTPVTIIYPQGLAGDCPPEWDLGALMSGTVVHDRQGVRNPLFSLEMAWQVAARNGLVSELGNSFLVAASPMTIADNGPVLAAHYGFDRPAEFARETQFVANGPSIDVRTRSTGNTAQLAAAPWAHDEYRRGTLWFDQLLRLVNRPNWTKASLVGWAGTWLEALKAVEPGDRASAMEEWQTYAHLLPGHYIDATPTNLIVDAAGKGHFFDLEWTLPSSLPLEFVLFRGLFLTLGRMKSCLPPAADVPEKLADLTLAVLADLGYALTEDDFSVFVPMFNAFQNYAMGLPDHVMNPVTQSIDSARLPVRAIPGASKNREARKAQAATQAANEEAQRLADLLDQATTMIEAKQSEVVQLQQLLAAQTAEPVSFGSATPVVTQQAADAPAPQSVSVVICSIDDVRFDLVCRNYQRLLRDVPHEIIRVADADSLCEGYNRAIGKATGDIVIFSHDDITLFSEEFQARLFEHMRHVDVLGLAGCTRLVDASWVAAGAPHIHGQVAHRRPQGGFSICVYGNHGRLTTGIKAVDGLFFAVRRHVAEEIRFDETTFDGFHLYDLDFSYRAHRAGFRLGVCTDIAIAHDSEGEFDNNWQRYALRFRDKHGVALDRPTGYKSRFAVIEVPTAEDVVRVFSAS